MIYGSVCSGIEAASVAWHPLGWRAAWFSEIEPFPSAVLARHYPDVPNLGDMTRFKEWPDAAIDLLVGGTPCQSYSIAGLRKGLDDPRGELMLTYLAIARRYAPRWVVWENVPGVLSSNGGRDFGTLLGGLAELGYGFAYRVLDAQYIRVESHARAVPQRRRRVFVVGYLGDWRRAAAVLFERESMLGHPAPRRAPGQSVAPTVSARTRSGGGFRTDFECNGGLIQQAFGGNNTSGAIDVAAALNAKSTQRQDFETETLLVAHALRAEGFDASEDGTGRGTPLIPVAQAVSLRGREGGGVAELSGDVATALRASQGGGDKMHALIESVVRRLTPRECERLQGFPDDYTAISVKGKRAKDGPRYKACGNSMAIPPMRWIGERIALVDSLTNGQWGSA
ncbi:DNA methyltransferase [Burkholderia ubonensis]|uniref:DNA cytosine methyltransferase n=1 Tax=Burkholderia ubonensis TaxID=101571 RepID=UPI000754F3E6|nr:DNA cytosine methyltransferase [Burkholderia ubonensis]KWI27909.1 DNA methyltransferase [Burkholderia ubonensis]OJB14032.1 DNA (cytosine-5-)-methyltransferase [Burkholderia ubonensis]